MITIDRNGCNHTNPTPGQASRRERRVRGTLATTGALCLLLIAACAEREPPATADTAAPDTAAPDTAAPDTAAPDTAAPDTAAPGAGSPGDSAATGDATIGERAIGTIRLGMQEADLRGAHAGARDTTWQAEGMDEHGVIVPIGPGEATALLVDGAVARINVRDRGLKTASGLGVGSSLGELRAAYGRACAATGEDGRAVVWFAAQPGVSFALDQRPAARANAIQEDPSLLPDDAVVEELWVHGESIAC